MHQFPISWECSQELRCPSVEVGYALKAGDKEVKSFVEDIVRFDDKNNFSVILYSDLTCCLIGRKTGQIPLELLGANPLQQLCVFTIDIRVLTMVEFSNQQEEPDFNLDSLYPYGLLEVMAEGLKTPSEGDVEFRCKSEDGEEGKLYASSRVLSSTSDYFKTSLTSLGHC